MTAAEQEREMDAVTELKALKKVLAVYDKVAAEITPEGKKWLAARMLERSQEPKATGVKVEE